MRRFFFIFSFLCISFFFFTSCNKKKASVLPGVALTLAKERKELLSNIEYTLHFDIPQLKTDSIKAKETIRFYMKEAATALQVDFNEDKKMVDSVIVNEKIISPQIENEHILIPAKYLQKGDNTVNIIFTAGNGALNRKEDFLYTLFVPDRARTVFPCFDQPDLKAVFRLSLTIPKEWQAIANADVKDSVLQQGKKLVHFMPTDTLPTYLFSFAAGAFKIAQDTMGAKPVTLFYRETDAAKIETSLAEIFNQYKSAVRFCEAWTGITYPFQKHGMVAIPDFQFGGMEHPGAILLQSSTLFLNKEATQTQLNNRSHLMAHEVAHMWFGDMVTMSWFSDVWMKEVFANFISDKATEKDSSAFALKFLTEHFPLAYSTDRTTGSNPIRQNLDNLNDAGSMYGNIIYQKAPIMMQQLEILMGKEKFQTGVQEYLSTFKYSNASWPDLINILDRLTPVDLQQWNKIWVNEPGRPVFDYTTSNTMLSFIQKPEYDKPGLWSQAFNINLFYKDSTITIPLYDSTEKQDIDLASHSKPLFTVFNSTGIGYGVWPVDTMMYPHIYQIKDPVTRASIYINLYENMLNGRYNTPAQLLNIYLDGLSKENKELNLRLATNYISSIYWYFTNAHDRQSIRNTLEKTILEAITKQTEKNNRKTLFLCYQAIFTTDEAKRVLWDVWKYKKPFSGISLSDEDYTNLALALALRDDNNAELLAEQLTRITNTDRQKRFKILMQAASSNPAERDSFFNGLSQKSNRANESAVSTALGLLHHPLRQSTSQKYLPQTLSLLEEIQKTGAIFFPGWWLQNSFGYYQDKAAYNISTAFLTQRPGYNPKLKAKILQATDNNRRSIQLLTRQAH